MQAAQLYENELYAYYDEPPRGGTPLGAAKVRLRGTESRKSSWETNRKTYAHVTVVEPGNNKERASHWGKHGVCVAGDQLTIPARHLIDFWSEYEAEANFLRSERKERSDRQRRHVLREQMLTSMINRHLSGTENDKGVPFAVAILDLYKDGSGFVKFQLKDIIQWLEIDTEAIDEKIEEAME